MLKYYIYISKNKLNMLRSQLPYSVRNIGANLSVNLGIINGGTDIQMPSQEEPLTKRLEVTAKYINQFGDVGTLDSPKAWLQDTQFVKVVTFEHNPEVVFFIGSTPGTEFLLGGSASNLNSNEGRTDLTVGWSFLPFLLEKMQRLLDDEFHLTLSNEIAKSSLGCGVGSNDGREWHDLVNYAQGYFSGPKIKVEFLAKSLLIKSPSTNNKKTSIVATPLYMAIAD